MTYPKPVVRSQYRDCSYLDPLLHRKSFEFEDVVRLSAQQASRVKEARRSGLFHALSEDSIYEDIICEWFWDSQDTCHWSDITVKYEKKYVCMNWKSW